MKSASSRLKEAGRSSIAMWPVSSKMTLRELGINSSNTLASATGITLSSAPHTISVGQAISGRRSPKFYS